VALAARGSRNLDHGEEHIEDEWLLDQLRRQARKVQVEALLVAALVTALFVWLPI
jgi:hypothetical protein